MAIVDTKIDDVDKGTTVGDSWVGANCKEVKEEVAGAFEVEATTAIDVVRETRRNWLLTVVAAALAEVLDGCALVEPP